MGDFGWVTIKFKGFHSKDLKYSETKINEDWSQTYIHLFQNVRYQPGKFKSKIKQFKYKFI